jgi:hypothetical protein
VHFATWDAKVTQYYDTNGVNQSPAWHVHIQSTSCEDLGSETGLGNFCNLYGDAFFYVVTRNVNGHRVKTCEPDYQPNGYNIFVTFTPSVGEPINNGGQAYLSLAYTDDQPLPQKAQASFHFYAQQLGTSSGGALFVAGAATGLQACAKSDTTLRNGVVGYVHANIPAGLGSRSVGGK